MLAVVRSALQELLIKLIGGFELILGRDACHFAIDRSINQYSQPWYLDLEDPQLNLRVHPN